MSDNRIKPIVMPKWGLSMKEGKVTSWLAEEGTRIDVGKEILEVETDKIAGVVEAADSGVLRRRVGTPLRVIDIAIHHRYTDRIDPGLQLECLGLRFARRQQELLRTGVVLSQCCLFMFGQREHVGALKFGCRGKLIDTHRHRLGRATLIRILIGAANQRDR